MSRTFWGGFALVILLALSMVALLWVQGDFDDAPPPPLADGIHVIDASNLLRRVGHVKAPSVREASALIKSVKHSGVFWTLCDAHNPPYLFAITETGKLLATIQPGGASNIDWEALAIDDEGRIYIGDIGNNHLHHPRRTIYQIDEPDQLPAEPAVPHAVPVRAVFHFTYPSKPFDAESLIIQDRHLYVINKTPKQGETFLYRLSLDSPGETQAIEQLGKLHDSLYFIADASLAPDHRRLALANKYFTAVFDLPNGHVTDILNATPTIYRYNLHKIEGCAWDGSEIVLIDEDRKVYRLTP